MYVSLSMSLYLSLYFVPEIPTFHLKFVYMSLCTSLSEKHQKSCTLYFVNFDKGTKTVYLCTWKKFQNQGHSALTYVAEAGTKGVKNVGNGDFWRFLPVNSKTNFFSPSFDVFFGISRSKLTQKDLFRNFSSTRTLSAQEVQIWNGVHRSHLS